MALSDAERNRIKALENKVATLMEFMEKKNRQQITFPLDTASQEIIKKI